MIHEKLKHKDFFNYIYHFKNKTLQTKFRLLVEISECAFSGDVYYFVWDQIKAFSLNDANTRQNTGPSKNGRKDCI